MRVILGRGESNTHVVIIIEKGVLYMYATVYSLAVARVIQWTLCRDLKWHGTGAVNLDELPLVKKHASRKGHVIYKGLK